MRLSLYFIASFVAACATGGGDTPARDAGAPLDTGNIDAHVPTDTGSPADSAVLMDAMSLSDAGVPTDAAVLVDLALVDSSTPADIGVSPDLGGPVSIEDGGSLSSRCRTDADCVFGAEWCVGGECSRCVDVEVCGIRCARGKTLLMRNGCSPCTCVPANACDGDTLCSLGSTCYAGNYCWDWCPSGDPSCCYGNICEAIGCTTPPPTGCATRGCPLGATCLTGGAGGGPSSCDCVSGSWSCVDDDAGGICAEELEARL